MFLIFINDITDEIVGLGRLFADDTSIGHIAQDESFNAIDIRNNNFSFGGINL
jgi:hypothetical protein